jgi:hypothetical protein
MRKSPASNTKNPADESAGFLVRSMRSEKLCFSVALKKGRFHASKSSRSAFSIVGGDQPSLRPIVASRSERSPELMPGGVSSMRNLPVQASPASSQQELITISTGSKFVAQPSATKE